MKIREIAGGVAASVKNDAVDVGRQVALAACGLVTTIAVVLLNAWVAGAANFNLLSLSFWFVIPAGAVIGGMAAAIGYYGGALLTQTMPTKQIAWSMVGIAAGAWFFSHWLEYASMTFADGTNVSDTVEFWEYLKFSAEHQTLTIGTSRNPTSGVNTGELGVLGYAREGLQLLGFVGGGLSVYGFLRNKEACADCRRYAKVTRVLSGVSAGQFDDAIAHLGITVPGLVEECESAIGERPLLGMNLTLAKCPTCYAFWARPEAIVQGSQHTDVLPLCRYEVEPGMAGRMLALPASMRVPVKAD